MNAIKSLLSMPGSLDTSLEMLSEILFNISTDYYTIHRGVLLVYRYSSISAAPVKLFVNSTYRQIRNKNKVEYRQIISASTSFTPANPLPKIQGLGTYAHKANNLFSGREVMI